MRATVLSVEAHVVGGWARPFLRGKARVLLDLPHGVAVEIAGPQNQICLVGPGDAGRLGGLPVEVEGSFLFPKRPEELTELSIHRPEAAGIEVGTTWEVAPTRFGPITRRSGKTKRED